MTKDANPYQPPTSTAGFDGFPLTASQRFTVWTGSVGAFLVFWLIFGVGLTMLTFLIAHVFSIESVAAVIVGSVGTGAGISYVMTRRYHLEAISDFQRENELSAKPDPLTVE
ncbi:MAG: hypothetical protein NXI04_23545 [Planctomycetaceae bacterium]|nr:hypothetical protein [Planctomycetaceae bacterium]